MLQTAYRFSDVEQHSLPTKTDALFFELGTSIAGLRSKKSLGL
jgi:hypothetical protein